MYKIVFHDTQGDPDTDIWWSGTDPDEALTKLKEYTREVETYFDDCCSVELIVEIDD